MDNGYSRKTSRQHESVRMPKRVDVSKAGSASRVILSSPWANTSATEINHHPDNKMHDAADSSKHYSIQREKIDEGRNVGVLRNGLRFEL